MSSKSSRVGMDFLKLIRGTLTMQGAIVGKWPVPVAPE